MFRKSTFLVVTALVAGVAANAQAQLCAGTAPFTAGQMRVGVGAEFPEAATTYGGELAWGRANGMFVGGTVAHTSFDASDASAMSFGARGGYEMRFASMPKVRFCPVASLGYATGPDAGAVEMSAIGYGLGGAVGGVLSASENLAIVPSATLSWVGSRMKATVGNSSSTESDSWAEARLAAGLVFNRAITIAPVVTIPMGLEDADARFGFAASFNFGRSGAVAQQGNQKKGRKR